jgi:hypothetical protein
MNKKSAKIIHMSSTRKNFIALKDFCTLICYAWNITRTFFLIDEGPCSRCYGRTTALRLIVQPYDEAEDDYYFLSFS